MIRRDLKIDIPRSGKRVEDFNLCVTAESQSLTTNLDMDALFGGVTVTEFLEGYKGDIQINLDDTSSFVKKRTEFEKIKCKNHFIEGENVKNFPHVKIGVTHTRFGLLDFYIVFKKLDSTLVEFNKMIFEEVKNILESSGIQMASDQFIVKENLNQLSGNILNKDFLHIVRDLEHKFEKYEMIMFFETLGNKRSTIGSAINFDDIKQRIVEVFDPLIFKHISIDICISVRSGDDTVTFANANFFESIGIKPNFIPLFSDCCLNYHKNALNKDGKLSKIGKVFNSSKLNFYSTFKYHFDFDKFKGYFYTLSNALMLTDILGHRTYAQQNKLSSLVDSYKSVESKQSCKNGGTCAYRLELRCDLTKVSKVIDRLSSYITVGSFDYCSSKSFFDILQKNILIFINSITSTSENLTSHDRIIFSKICEGVFKQNFIGGSKDVSLFRNSELNSLVKNEIAFCNMGFPVVSDLYEFIKTSIFELISVEKRKEIFFELIKYSPRINSNQRNLLDYIPSLLYSRTVIDELSFMETLVSIYCHEIKGSTVNGSNDLKTVLEPGSTASICAMKAIKRAFIQKKLDTKSKISKIVFSIFLKKFNLTSEQGINNIFNFMKENFYVSCFKGLKDRSLVRLNFDGTIKVKSEKKNLLDQIIALRVIRSSSTGKPDSDEIVRFVHALYKYKDSVSRITDVLYDFTYGFYPIRNENWIKNRIHYLGLLTGSESSFIEIIQRVKNWLPENFTEAQRENYHMNNNFQGNTEFYNLYYDLVSLDIDASLGHTIFTEIIQSSPYDIFVDVVKNSFAHRGNIGLIRTWSDSYTSSSQGSSNILGSVEIQNVAAEIETEFISLNIDESYEPENNLFPFDGTVIPADNTEFYSAAEIIEMQDLNNDIVLDYTPQEPYDSEVFNNDDNNAYFEVSFDVNDHRPFEMDNTENIVEMPQFISLADPVDEQNKEYDSFRKKLFSKYRFRAFNSGVARAYIFGNKTRPSVDSWNNLIQKMTAELVINAYEFGNTNFKFNILLKSKKFLTSQYIKKFLEKKLSGLTSLGLTGFVLRQSIKYNIRPDKISWAYYLDDLVSERYLIATKVKGTYSYLLA